MCDIKMSDVFDLPISCEHVVDIGVSEFTNNEDCYAAIAINSHDQLAEENKQLREIVNSYKLASDKVTKYRYALSYNESYTGEPEGEMKNNLAELDMISCKAIKLLSK